MFKKYSLYLILSLFLLFFWIYFFGAADRILFHNLVPIEIPLDFFRLNTWLAHQEEEFKVIWLPAQYNAAILDWARDHEVNDFITLSSAKPNIRPETVYSKLHFLFLQSITGYFPNINKFFDILNTKYLILRKDLPGEYSPSLLASLQRDPGLKKIKQEEYLEVFENKNYAPLVWIPKKVIPVIGGMETLDLLNSKTDFDPVQNGLIFLNQEPGLMHSFKNQTFQNIIFNNANFEDLIFSLIENQYLVEIAPSTNEKIGEWQKASTEEPLHGEWHRVIDQLKVSNWDFDYGKGLVYSEDKDMEIKVPFYISEDTDYILTVRYFQNNHGGKLKIKKGNKEKIIQTLDLNNKFTTNTIPLGKVAKGKHFLIIQNLVGFNAVNLLALVPEEKYQSYKKQAQEIITQTPVTYLQKINPAEMTEPLNLKLPKGDEYTVLIRFKNDPDQINKLQNQKEEIISYENLAKENPRILNLTFGKKQYSLEHYFLDLIKWYQIGEEYFTADNQISLLANVEERNFLTTKNFFILDPENLKFSNNEESPKGSNTSKQSSIPQSIMVDIPKNGLNPNREGRLITNAIQVEENQGFYLEYQLCGQNLANLDARVLFYGKDYDLQTQRTAFKVEYFMENRKNNLEPQKISHFFGTPDNTYYIKIEFKAKTNPEKDSWFEISNSKLFRESDINIIDALFLEEKQEKIEEKETPSLPHLQYQKINPTKIKIDLQNKPNHPFVVAFAESYDQRWHITPKTDLKQNGLKEYFRKIFLHPQNEIKSFPLYSVINGFYIDPAGLTNNELTLEYEPQNWFKGGLLISATSLILILCVLLIGKMKRKNQ